MKIYSGTIEQNTTTAPSLVDFEWNFINFILKTDYVSQGVYSITAQNSGNAVELFNTNYPTRKFLVKDSDGYYTVEYHTNSEVIVSSFDSAGTPLDNILQKDLFELHI